MTITEFLTARYDEDERRAPMYREITGWLAAVFGPVDASMKEVQPGMAAQIALARTADRIDADIAAKRAVVAMHTMDRTDDGEECAQCSFHELYEGFNDVSEPWPCLTLRLFAQPYAEHPDFDPAWRVDA